MSEILKCLRFSWTYLWSILTQSQMPVWLTLVAGILGFLVTYWLVPELNQKFEQQRIRTEFVISKLDALNVRTNNLVGLIAVLNNRVINGDPNTPDLNEDLFRSVSELHWTALDLGVVFRSATAAQYIQEYQRSLDALRKALEDDRSLDNSLEVLERSGEFVRSSIRLMDYISRDVALNDQYIANN